MQRCWMIILIVGLFAAGCTRGPAERVVQIDFRNDEFPSHYWRFFPRSVDAHAGDTVVFRQQWTGEPHTVTLGTLVDEAIPAVAALDKKYKFLDDYYRGQHTSPPPREIVEAQARAEKEFKIVTRGLPSIDQYSGGDAQNAEEPCYLRDGGPPSDPNTACAARFRRQPTFDSSYTFYSSGFIPPSGASGNSYRVRLSSKLKPGPYHFYCVTHYPDMQGVIVVKPRSAKLRTQAELNVQARSEIEHLSKPLEKAYVTASRGSVRTGGDTVSPPIAGYHAGDEYTVAIDAFVPKTISTRVGRAVTWTIVGAHTVSFGTPRYLPIYEVHADGTVRRNLDVDKAAGGSPQPPPVDFTHPTYRIDGGTYSGTGFYSSGLLGSEPYSTYTLRFAKPGRYRYACLVHPPMVGTVLVEP